MKIICEHCGEEFISPVKIRKFAHKKCDKTYMMITCPQCGKKNFMKRISNNSDLKNY